MPKQSATPVEMHSIDEVGLEAPSDLLLTTERGSQLHRSAVLRSVSWSSTGQGRRLHDLRHTAACLWLARRVDLGTVQAWR